ncbi:glycosyltransferase family 2 protein [Crocinitomix catalasitica]|uniref:glycosyltransferase family 2 protein n=1 Tax=Crocinitomix catalasitica TaxID=184607 RepID=UPI000684F456|nr:glycosyltransferase family 2 protein [Crocinitomix catalasitica]
MNPLISIVTPSYNKAEFLTACINSVIEQTYKNWELIIIDDCSTDGTKNIADNFAVKHDQIKSKSNATNKGANYCRNEGLKLAKGEYILFFDADDVMTENCLSNQIESASNFPAFDFWVFNMGVFEKQIEDRPKTEYWILPSNLSHSNILSKFLKHQILWGTPQVLWRKTTIEKLNGFNLNYNRLQDVELHTRALIADLKGKLFSESSIEIFYRIDEKRLNFNTDVFYEKFVKACCNYYADFYAKVESSLDKKDLIGTLFEALSTIQYQYRVQNLSKKKFEELTQLIFETCNDKTQLSKLKNYNRINTLSPIHPKGLKFIFKYLLKLN